MLPMEQIKKYKRGDLVYCDILRLAASDWEIAVEGGNLLNLQNTVSSWPKVLAVVVEVRKTLKVAKIYVLSLNRCARSPYDCLFTVEEENEHYKK
jgi:hypothetical protein